MTTWMSWGIHIFSQICEKTELDTYHNAMQIHSEKYICVLLKQLQQSQVQRLHVITITISNLLGIIFRPMLRYFRYSGHECRTVSIGLDWIRRYPMLMDRTFICGDPNVLGSSRWISSSIVIFARARKRIVRASVSRNRSSRYKCLTILSANCSDDCAVIVFSNCCEKENCATLRSQKKVNRGFAESSRPNLRSAVYLRVNVR